MLSYFDTHSHLNLSPLKEKKEEIIKTLEKESIGTIIVGTDYDSSLAAVETAKQSPNLFACVGLHPTENVSFDFQKFKKLGSDEKVVAIGECGLDYFHSADKTKQKENFLAQIELAKELKLPLMIHCRPSKRTMDAYRDLLEILKDYPNVSGNMHFFSGNLEVAREFLNLGFTLSFAGPITFIPDYDRVIEYAPLDMILAETDAPFAAPAPYRGETNYPFYVKEVVRRISEIKKRPLEEVKEKLLSNAKRVFNLQKIYL